MQDVLSRYLPRFYRSAYRQLGNAADAEDAVQDALLAAYHPLGSVQRSGANVDLANLHRYELRADAIAETAHANPTCRWMSHLGKIRNIPCQIVWRIPDRVLKTSVGSRNCAGVFSQSVAQLSPSLRRAFELCDLDGLTVKEAAHTLGVAEGTVKAQISRARAKLTRLMRRALRPKPRSVLARAT